MFNVKVTFLDQISRAVSQQMNEGSAEPFVHSRSDFIELELPLTSEHLI